MTTAWEHHTRRRSIGTEWIQPPPKGSSVTTFVEPIRPTVNEDVGSIVGRNLHRLRKQHRLSLEALSRQSGVSRAMLGQVEQGKSVPSIKTLWQIGQALGVSVSWFLEASVAAQVLLLSPDAESHESLQRGEAEMRSLLQANGRSRDDFYELRLGPGALLRQPVSYSPRRINLAVSCGALLAEVDDVAHVVKAREALQYQTTNELIWRNVGQVEAHAFVFIRDGISLD